MILPEAEVLLAPIADVEGFRLACLIDASTGMILASLQNQDDIALLAAAAGAADIASVLALLNGRLATGESFEDVMVTFSNSFYMVNLVRNDQDPQLLLLVVLDRLRTNLAMARRAIRDFCAGVTP